MCLHKNIIIIYIYIHYNIPARSIMRSNAYKEALLSDLASASKKLAASKDKAVAALAKEDQFESAIAVP